MKKTLLIITLALFGLSNIANAQKLADLATKPDLINKVYYDHSNVKVDKNGKGFTIKPGQLPNMPKKVALVTFFGHDPGNLKKGQTMTNNGDINMSKFANRFAMSPEDMKKMMNEIHATTINPIKEIFKKENMELLTPSEFLNTDAKKSYYNNFVVEHNKVQNVFAGIVQAVTMETPKVDEAADSYRVIDFKNSASNGAAEEDLGRSQDDVMLEGVGYNLAKELGVDAVVCMYLTVTTTEKGKGYSHFLNTVSCYMVGPNPIAESLGKEECKKCNKGVFYGGTRIFFKEGLLINPKSKKITDEQIKSDNIKAFENIYTALVQKLVQYLKEK